MIKYLLLDFDGTLVNTLPLTTKAVREFVVDYKGIDANITEKAVLEVMSLPGDLICQHFLGDIELDMDEYYDVFAPTIDALATKGKPFPNVKATLKQLKEMGVKLFLLSNKDDGTLKRYAESIFTKSSFDGYQGKIPGMPAKPAPFMLQNVLKQYHLNPSEGLVVGDSEVDLETAINGKMKCVIMNYGYADKAQMEKLPKPDFAINDFKELIKIVEDSKD